MVDSSSGAFNWRNSREHLVDLTNLGPRVVGSKENEVEAVRMIHNALGAIEPRPGCVVETDVQRVSGSFHHAGFLGGFTSVYSELSNVVAKISWPEPASGEATSRMKPPAVLVNAHFDSAAGTSGASDDGVGIATMLEVARVLAHGPALERDVVLLFNGAEESNQQGAHGFITQHPWADDLGIVVNLEALGSGGRMHLFQCNSARVARLYGHTTLQPYGSVIGHELFR